MGAAADSATVKFLDDHGGKWVKERSCVSCHSAWSYAMGRIGTPGWQTSPVAELRDYAMARQKNWDTIDPWYGSRTSPKGLESFGSEAVVEASLLVEADLAESGAITALTDSSVRHMLALQLSDGGLPWLDYRLEPLESVGARIFGTALARVTVSRSGLSSDPVLAGSVKRLDAFLASAARNPETSLYNRVAVAWASGESGAVLAASELSNILQTLTALQNVDGGWSMNRLGSWIKQGSASGPNDSDANATAFVLTALRGLERSPSGAAAEFQRLLSSASQWLSSHMNADGSWSGVSVNRDSEFNRALMTDFATGLASRALK